VFACTGQAAHKEITMKNMVKLQAMLRIAGIIALTAVIVFSMAACWLAEEKEDIPADIAFPEALAGTTEDEDGITWDIDGSNESTGNYQTVRFCNIRNLHNGYFYYRGYFEYGGLWPSYNLKSVNGDSYTVGYYKSSTDSLQTEVTFTAKVSGNKLTISNSTGESDWNGTYTKKTN
jgi:hypothetical protein